jgi:hypothetical protein
MKEYSWHPSCVLGYLLQHRKLLGYQTCHSVVSHNDFIDAIVSMIMESWPDPSCIELTAKEGLSSDDKEFISEIVERYELGDDPFTFVDSCCQAIVEECQRRVKEKEKS